VTIFVWKEEGTDGKKVALELASSCTWLFLQNFKTGLLSAREERGEQSVEDIK
jgi:hypothetical protein